MQKHDRRNGRKYWDLSHNNFYQRTGKVAVKKGLFMTHEARQQRTVARISSFFEAIEGLHKLNLTRFNDLPLKAII